MATVEVNLQKVVDAKSALKSSINAKLAIAGLNEIGSESISEYSGFINNIPVGSGYLYIKPGNVDYYSSWILRMGDGSIITYDGNTIAQPNDVEVAVQRSSNYDNYYHRYQKTINWFTSWVLPGSTVNITGEGLIPKVPDAIQNQFDSAVEWISPLNASASMQVTQSAHTFNTQLSAIVGTIGVLTITSITYTYQSITGSGNKLKMNITFQTNGHSLDDISAIGGRFAYGNTGNAVREFVAIVGGGAVSISGNTISIVFYGGWDGIYDYDGATLDIDTNNQSYDDIDTNNQSYDQDRFDCLWIVDNSGADPDQEWIGGGYGTSAYARYMNIPDSD